MASFARLINAIAEKEGGPPPPPVQEVTEEVTEASA
jgi:hypothetical protein